MVGYWYGETRPDFSNFRYCVSAPVCTLQPWPSCLFGPLPCLESGVFWHGRVEHWGWWVDWVPLFEAATSVTLLSFASVLKSLIKYMPFNLEVIVILCIKLSLIFM